MEFLVKDNAQNRILKKEFLLKQLSGFQAQLEYGVFHDIRLKHC